MPTLYDNFERVRQYIDQHQADVDLSSYVSYTYLESKNYIDDNVNLLHGPLFVDYSTPQNDSYTLSSYSHIVAGTEDKTGVSFVATKRKCGGEDGTTYMAAFFTNSDGRSKFAHKTKISNTGVGAQSDDAFMCFNAYGFRIAYSGTEGVSASTEYEILHEGNIGNLGYVTSSDLPVINENIVPKETTTYTLGDLNHLYVAAYTNRVNGPSSGLILRLGNSNKVAIYDSNMRAATANSMTLGNSSVPWVSTYSTNLYTNTAYLQDTSYSSSIVPKETTTYTLGDADHIYSNTYSRGVYLGTGVRMFSESSASSNDMAISLGGVSYYYFNYNRFAPNGAANNEKLDLGTSDRKWNHIYGKSVNADTAYIGDINYLYNTANGGLIVNRNGTNVCAFLGGGNAGISPQSNKGANLGNTGQMWNKIYAYTAYLQDTSYTKSIVPAENNSYTLGSSGYQYTYAYVSNLVMNEYDSGLFIAGGQYGGIKVRVAGIDRFNLSTGAIYPLRNQFNLGTSAIPFGYTYSYSIVLSPSYNSIDNVSNTRVDFKVNQNKRYKMTNVEFAPVVNNGVNLGSSSEQFKKTYTGELYVNGTNIEDRFTYLIWTGTSAEYAALDNYTSYQIYMIEKDAN